jgi:uncharacterized membrane protein YtjA (UPF0391 family)
MLLWSFIFLILALIGGLLGFSSLAGATAVVAQVLCGVFLILWVFSTVRGLFGRKVH